MILHYCISDGQAPSSGKILLVLQDLFKCNHVCEVSLTCRLGKLSHCFTTILTVLKILSMYNYPYRGLPPSPQTVISSMSRTLVSSRVQQLHSFVLKLSDFGSYPIPTSIPSSYLTFSKLFNFLSVHLRTGKNEDNSIYFRIVMKIK